MRHLQVALVPLPALLALPSGASAQDSAAPKGALPHWLPNERWVYQPVR